MFFVWTHSNVLCLLFTGSGCSRFSLCVLWFPTVGTTGRLWRTALGLLALLCPHNKYLEVDIPLVQPLANNWWRQPSSRASMWGKSFGMIYASQWPARSGWTSIPIVTFLGSFCPVLVPSFLYYFSWEFFRIKGELNKFCAHESLS